MTTVNSLSRSRSVPITDPLPAAWLRRAATSADRDAIGDAVLRVGPDARLHQALTTTIDEAREVVLAASFLLADAGIASALLNAAKRSVRVYVLSASDDAITKDVRDDDGSAERLQEHKSLLDQLAGRVLLRSAPHFHAKFLVTDPESEPRGWLSTANFNKALRESVELGIRLDRDAARAVAGWFARAFWLEAEHELAAKGRLAGVTAAPAVPLEPSNPAVFVTAKGRNTLRDEALRIVKGASTGLTIACFGLSPEHAVLLAVLERARAGVPVTVLTRPRPAVREAASALFDAGAKVLAHDKLHAKAVVSDAGALVMTANLEPHGLDTGFEVGVRVGGGGRQELARTLQDWAETFPWSFHPGARRSDHLGEICLADRGLRDGIRRVVEEKDVALSPVVADDALRLEEAPDPNLKIPPLEEFPRVVHFRWEVRPPALPRKAQERTQTLEREVKGKGGRVTKVPEQVPLTPRVFDHAGQVFVLLSNGADEQVVRETAARLNARVVVP